MASVRFRHIYKRSGSYTTIENLDLEIFDKEFICIVGDHGSEILKLVAGIEKPSDGEILIGDRVVNNVAPPNRDITYVPGGSNTDFGLKDGSVLRRMTIYDNMAEDLLTRKIPKQIIDQRIREVSKVLGIEHVLDRRISQLSRGQKQRAAIGKAIVAEPAVFLFDDILAPLDPKLRVEARSFLAKLHQRLDTTTIMHCDDFEEALTMATRIVIMKNGQMQQLGTPLEIYRNPYNVTAYLANTRFYRPLLIDGKISLYKKDQLSIDTRLGKIMIPGHKTKALNSYIGHDVLLGARTENIFDEAYQPAGITPFKFSATIEFTEFVNGNDYAHFSQNGVSGVATFDPRTSYQAGTTLEFVLNTDTISIFQKENGVSLLYEHNRQL